MGWQDVEVSAAAEGISSRIMGMEVIQVHLLDAIFSRTESAGLSFQGGTCLRLVHGGHRYSEDLDFVDDKTSAEALDGLMQRSTRSAGARLAAVLGPGETKLGAMTDGGAVLSWWFRYQRSGAREVLRVKLEVGRYPAHDVAVRATTATSFSPLPTALVRACSLRELLADKVNALAQREYVKGRDLYDIWFLNAMGVETDRNLARRKFQDYGTRRPLEKLSERMQVLEAGEVSAEMERFLPSALRQHLAATGYAEVLVAVRKVIREVLE